MNRLRTIAYVLFLVCGGVCSSFAKDNSRSAILEWERVPRSSGYGVRVSKVEDGQETVIHQEVKVSQPQWKAQLPPGRYHFTTRSYDMRGIPGQWGEVFQSVVSLPQVQPRLNKNTFYARQDQKADVAVSWSEVVGAEKYIVSIFDDMKSVVLREEVKKTRVTLEVPASERLTLQVVALSEEGDVGDAHAPLKFSVFGARLEVPVLEVVKNETPLTVRWKRPEGSEHFEWELQKYNFKSKTYRLSSKQDHFYEDSVKFDSLVGGSYHFKLRALAQRRSSSEWVSQTFNYSPERNLAAVEKSVNQIKINEQQIEARKLSLLLDVSNSSYFYNVNVITGQGVENRKTEPEAGASSLRPTSMSVRAVFELPFTRNFISRSLIEGTTVGTASQTETNLFFSGRIQSVLGMKQNYLSTGFVEGSLGLRCQAVPEIFRSGSSIIKESMLWDFGPVIGVKLASPEWRGWSLLVGVEKAFGYKGTAASQIGFQQLDHRLFTVMVEKELKGNGTLNFGFMSLYDQRIYESTEGISSANYQRIEKNALTVGYTYYFGL